MSVILKISDLTIKTNSHILFGHNNVSVHTITILLQWPHYRFPSFRGQQLSSIKWPLNSHGCCLPETERAQRTAVMGTLQKADFVAVKIFFCFWVCHHLWSHELLKFKTSFVSKELKRKFYLQKYHLLFKKGMTDSCAYSMLFVKKLFHQWRSMLIPFYVFFREYLGFF